MKWIDIALGVAFSGLLAAGQLLFKAAAARRGDTFETVLLTGHFAAALVLYGAATLLYLFLLTRVQLSFAYSFTFLGSAGVYLAAHLIWGERLSFAAMIGVFMMLGGLYLIVRTG